MTVWTVPATVVSVVDGDTAHLVLDLGWHITFTARVRVAGINAPELNTDAGVAAKAFAETLLPAGTSVTFTSHTLDKWGRPLGAITLPGCADFAAAMLDAGHAVVMVF